MKKLFLIAVAGLMMFAFAQCGGGSEASKSDEGDPSASAIKIMNNTIDAVKKAKECDDLIKIVRDYEKQQGEFQKKYPNFEPTEVEEKELRSLGEKVEEAIDRKMEQLDCEEDW